MTRTYDNIQEVGYLADNGKTLRTDAIAEVSIAVTRRYEKDEQGRERGREYIAHIYFRSARTDEAIATYERPFNSLEEICDLFGIDDIDEVWEIID